MIGEWVSTCGCGSVGEENWGHCGECGDPTTFIWVGDEPSVVTGLPEDAASNDVYHGWVVYGGPVQAGFRRPISRSYDAKPVGWAHDWPLQGFSSFEAIIAAIDRFPVAA